MDEKNLEKNENLEKKSPFFDLEKILPVDESINFYSQNLPSAGKLNRMLLAGYYALRWIDEKIDNVTQFMENILAVRNEAERIIGLPESANPEKSKNKHVKIELTENLLNESFDIIKPGGDFIGYHWEADEYPQSELDKVTEFLESKGYKLTDVENTEFMPLYVYEKSVEVGGEKYNKKAIEIFADRNGDIHI